MYWTGMNTAQKISAIDQAIQELVSYGKLAKKLHTTRGAVIGFANRNGLLSKYGENVKGKPTPRYKRGTMGINNNPRRAKNFCKNPEPITVGAFSPLPWSKPVNLFDRTGCCWPVGEGLFCDMPKDENDYCTTHGKRRIRHD